MDSLAEGVQHSALCSVPIYSLPSFAGAGSNGDDGGNCDRTARPAGRKQVSSDFADQLALADTTAQPRPAVTQRKQLQQLSVFACNRTWSATLHESIGTFLMATTWMVMVFGFMAVMAIPFWAMVISTSGFYGRYSQQLADVRESGEGIPYMQPYSLHDVRRASISSILAALSFGTLLEDTDLRDLVSRVRFGHGYLGRDWFLLGVLL